MAILNSFEVVVLTPSQTDLNSSSAATKRCWQAVREHDAPDSNVVDRPRSDYCQKYIAASQMTNPLLGDQQLSEFAIDFKVNCGFTFADNDESEFIVFRTYLDDTKIGSGFVKRERWERSGSYRVRKKGRRFWVPEEWRWIEQKWFFDQGLHGTLRVEVWRERVKPPSSGSWDHPGLPTETNDFGEFVDLTVDTINANPKRPRVRHTSKVDFLPLATFVFEYRSKDTLKLLGMLEDPPRDTPLIDLTYNDLPHLKADPSNVYQLSSSIDSTSPCKTISEEMMDFFAGGTEKLYDDTDVLEPGQSKADFSDMGMFETPEDPFQPYQIIKPVSNAFCTQILDARSDHRHMDGGRAVEVVDLTMLD